MSKGKEKRKDKQIKKVLTHIESDTKEFKAQIKDDVKLKKELKGKK